MQPVPMPQILDADRMSMPERGEFTADDHAELSDALHRELTRSCEYGTALWQTLEVVRTYLSEAQPVSNQDDAGWKRWRVLYGAVTSSLAGPTGDSGFGAEEAKVLEQHTRSA